MRKEVLAFECFITLMESFSIGDEILYVTGFYLLERGVVLVRVGRLGSIKLILRCVLEVVALRTHYKVCSQELNRIFRTILNTIFE